MSCFGDKSLIKVLFFAHLKERLGCDSLMLKAAPATVAQVRQQILEMHPKWREDFESLAKLSAVNQTICDDNQLVETGDEVAFFPPVTGG